MNGAPREIGFRVNGSEVHVREDPRRRLSDVLRESLGLTGTKVGCNAGDCGACTVLLRGQPVCACMVPVGRVSGAEVITVEGLSQGGRLSAVQEAFHRLGAAQCGICTPGMLMAATHLLSRNAAPSEGEVKDALGGVLCRCTGYRKIVQAVMQAARGLPEPTAPSAGAAVGFRLGKVDGIAKLTGEERFGADEHPDGALWLRAVRSPFPRAGFTLGAFDTVYERFPGLLRVLTAADIPGSNRFGIYPHLKDQPVLAEGRVNYRGEVVLALVGDRETIQGITDDLLPLTWTPQRPVSGIDAALASDAPRIHDEAPGNVLTRARIAKGDVEAALAGSAVVAEGEWETPFVEHAYIEPEAGLARRVADRVEVVACTQTPYMDRDEVALILGIRPEQVRVIPTAVGGGFGGKLDLSLQPLVAVAAWLLGRPVRCVYSRPESMAATTKRHPAQMKARFGCDREGLLTAIDFQGDYNTGAYASWGPTVAGRVPVHATGPYFVPAMRAEVRAVYTNQPPAGAFRGFGTPQAAIAHEALMDALAERLDVDRLEFRLRNALRVGKPTNTGQVLTASVGLTACLEALQPHWQEAARGVTRFNANGGSSRRGVGIGCMWYGIGNTAMSNPSRMKVGLSPDGTLTLFNGAVDIGQGSNTILSQICADALGVEVSRFNSLRADTDRTPDAGKTSASRQTLVSGRAVQLAAEDLRGKLLQLADAPPDARIELAESELRVRYGAVERSIDLSGLPVDGEGCVLVGHGTFDPPTTPLDEENRGSPYASYAFAAQMAVVEVDAELGTVRPVYIVAAHDVGRAINPQQVEGQIHGGIAQGLGLALMEAYLPGQTENLHDYLIPTFGDVPEIEVILIEDPDPHGPSGAKGIGEPALIPTAPAILGAIRHAVGVDIRRIPATPDRVREAILAAKR